jgi:hypothetical protein
VAEGLCLELNPLIHYFEYANNDDVRSNVTEVGMMLAENRKGD